MLLFHLLFQYQIYLQFPFYTADASLHVLIEDTFQLIYKYHHFDQLVVIYILIVHTVDQQDLNDHLYQYLKH